MPLRILCLWLIAFSASADSITLTNGEWPPYLSETYTHFGLASHIVEEAFKLEDVDVNYEFYPWARAFNFVQSGTREGSVVWSFNEERAKDVLYSDPVFELRTVFFHRKDRQFSWNSLSELKPYQIVATLGYYYGADFKELEESGELSVTRVNTDEQALRMLLAERVDLFAAQFEVGYEVLYSRFGPAIGAQVTNSQAIDSTAYHLIISRKSPKANDWITTFNRGLAKLKESGRFEAMMQSVIDGAYKPVRDGS